MREAGFNCKQCGNCCLNLSGAEAACASEEDVCKWQAEGRDDILEWVDPIIVGDQVIAYDIWVNPRTGDDVLRCPWLQKVRGKQAYICQIHDMKPEHCRNYPTSREHAEKTGCPGFK